MNNYINIVANNIKDASGSPLTSGTLTMQAVDPTGAPITFTLPSTGQAIILPVSVPVINGVASGLAVANPGLTSPQNIRYRITVTDSTGKQVLKFSAVDIGQANAWSLDTFAPASGSYPAAHFVDVPVSTSSITVGCSATPIFQGVLSSQAIGFEITLTQNVTSSTLANIRPGQIITYSITQDSVGGHTFAYPANVKNPATVSLTASTTTIQTFYADSYGNLIPTTWGVYVS